MYTLAHVHTRTHELVLLLASGCTHHSIACCQLELFFFGLQFLVCLTQLLFQKNKTCGEQNGQNRLCRVRVSMYTCVCMCLCVCVCFCAHSLPLQPLSPSLNPFCFQLTSRSRSISTKSAVNSAIVVASPRFEFFAEIERHNRRKCLKLRV